MGGGPRAGLLAERVRDIARAPPTRVTGHGKSARTDSVTLEQRRANRHARCSFCGAFDHMDHVLLPLPGGWCCARDLVGAYDLVLAGERLPPPPPLEPEEAAEVKPGPAVLRPSRFKQGPPVA